MSIDAFLEECNRSNLLEDYRSTEQPITRQTLEQADFIKPNYNLHDLALLRQRLFFIEPGVSPKLSLDNKVTFKDLRHWQQISKIDGKKLILSVRKGLGMPFPNRGFTTSLEYEDWLFSHTPLPSSNDLEEIFRHWQTNAAIVNKKVEQATEEVLSKWKLPKRYAAAVDELIMLNRIILAPKGAKRTLTWFEDRGHWKRIEGEEYDIDTTEEERIELQKKDVFGLYKNRASYLPGKAWKPFRRPEETQKLISKYNELKKEGRKGGKTDTEIFKLLQKDFPKLSTRAIQKRIKNY